MIRFSFCLFLISRAIHVVAVVLSLNLLPGWLFTDRGTFLPAQAFFQGCFPIVPSRMSSGEACLVTPPRSPSN